MAWTSSAWFLCSASNQLHRYHFGSPENYCYISGTVTDASNAAVAGAGAGGEYRDREANRHHQRCRFFRIVDLNPGCIVDLEA
jgi:hypothetical protein